jgi:hypothetical protein
VLIREHNSSLLIATVFDIGKETVCTIDLEEDKQYDAYYKKVIGFVMSSFSTNEKTDEWLLN